MVPEISGIFGPRSLADVILFLVDMKRVCLENPTYLDDIPPPSLMSRANSVASTQSNVNPVIVQTRNRRGNLKGGGNKRGGVQGSVTSRNTMTSKVNKS